MKKKKHIAPTLLALGAVVVIGGYVVTQQDRVAPQPAASDIEPGVLPTVPEPAQPVDEVVPPDGQTYRSIKVVTDQPGYEISREVGLANVPFVLSFNRMDEKHIQKNSTITIPPTFTDWDSLSPFPRDLPAAQDIDKLLLVSQRIQAVGAYEHGTLVRWMVTSTGKKETPTPSKLYFTNWKGKLVTSTLEGGYILPWAFNLDSMEGIAMHEFELPGYPASHACVRLLGADAEWIYNWAEQWILDASGQNELAKGTPVIIWGDYAYGKTAPWKKLATDPAATTLSVDELTEVVNKNIDEIKAAAEKRVEVENQ